MKRTIIKFGLIAGGIVSGFMIAGAVFGMYSLEHGAASMVYGYASMLLAFCFVYVAIKSYREKLGGAISFGKAFATGLGVAVVASLCYTLTWVIISKNFYPNFMDDYANHMLDAMRRSGKSPAAIAAAKQEFAGMKAVYNTWPGLIGYTLIEILPPGVLVTLISALILKRKATAPAGTVREIA